MLALSVIIVRWTLWWAILLGHLWILLWLLRLLIHLLEISTTQRINSRQFPFDLPSAAAAFAVFVPCRKLLADRTWSGQKQAVQRTVVVEAAEVDTCQSAVGTEAVAYAVVLPCQRSRVGQPFVAALAQPSRLARLLLAMHLVRYKCQLECTQVVSCAAVSRPLLVRYR